MRLFRRIVGVALIILGVIAIPMASSLFFATISGLVEDGLLYSLQYHAVLRGSNLLLALGPVYLFYSGFVLFKGKYGKLAYISFILAGLSLLVYFGFSAAALLVFLLR